MKILHIAPIGKLQQGIGTVLENLVPLQIENGNEVRIISPRENESYPSLSITCVNSKKGFLDYIHEWTPGVVQFHSVYWKEYLSIYPILVEKKIPYAIQLHGALSQENYKKNRWKKWLANQLFFNKFIKNAAGIIYLSDKEKELSLVPKLNRKSYIIPNGCEKPIFSVNTSSPKNILDFIYIGRLALEHKGLDKLVAALGILKNKGVTNCHFSFYGNPKDTDAKAFQQMLTPYKGLADFYGGIYGEDKYKRLHDADMFIQTSRFEGLPMGVLEALSYGVPCILTPGTNLAEIVANANAGWKTELNADAIADTIVSAVTDYREDYQTYRNNAIKLSHDYDWGAIAKQSSRVLEIIKKGV